MSAALEGLTDADDSELGRWQIALTIALFNSDLDRAEQVARAAVSKLPATAVLDSLVAVAMRNIGTLWENGEITVADEHAATAVASRLVDVIADGWLPAAPPERGTALLATPSSERHGLPLLMVDAVLRHAGFAVVTLGSDTPPDELRRAVARHRPGLVALSSTVAAPAELRASLESISVAHPTAQVLLGGTGSVDVPPAPQLQILAGMRSLLQAVGPFTPDRERAAPEKNPPPRVRTLPAGARGTPAANDWLTEFVSPESEADRARRALLQVAEEISHSASWIWNTESNEVVWSENVFRVLDVDPSGPPLTVEAFTEHVHPDDRDRLGEILELAEGGMTIDHTYRVRTAGGATRFVRSTSAARLRRPGGHVLVGWLSDITHTLQTDRFLAARAAVTEAIGSWSTVAEAGPRLLEGLASPLGFSHAALLVPAGDVLRALTQWEADDSGSFAAEVSALRLRRGQGIAGQAWEQRATVPAVDLRGETSAQLRAEALRHGYHSVVALPVIDGHEVLAVLTLAGRAVLEIDDRFLNTLEGVARELSGFLAGRRGELHGRVLSAREVEVLQLAAHGLSGPEIAARLHLSPTTVKTHFENIYAKYGVPDRVSAVAKALREGLIS